MKTTEFIVALILVILQFIGALALSFSLGGLAVLEWVLLILGIAWSVIVLIGIAQGRTWAWPVALFLFAASALNFLWMFAVVGSSVILAASLIVAVVSILVAFVGVDVWMPGREHNEVVTYEVKETAAKKKATRKKATRKKAARKKTSRRR